MIDFIKKLFSQTKTEKDPVCVMSVDPKNILFKSIHQGKTYYFCSEHCKNQFDKSPKEFIQ